MGDYHTFYCDQCGHEVPGADHLPRGWEQRGHQDWCDSCVEEELADLTAGLETTA